MQSSFTSMAEAISSRPATIAFPVNSILSERFESLDKIDSLKMPVLLLHGQVDSVVPAEMSERLYDAASAPHKQLFLIPGADYVSIYRPGENSYLTAIKRFMVSLPR